MLARAAAIPVSRCCLLPRLGRIAASLASRRGSATPSVISHCAPSRPVTMAAAAPATEPHPLAVALRLAADDAGIAAAGAMLRAGRCVAFPTETVYGLGANALDEAAVRSVFTFKGRPLSDPLIVHLPSPQAALSCLLLAPPARAVAEGLAARFWPGPLTLVGRAVPAIPLAVTAGTGFVGVRVPAHPIAARLLVAAGVPVAAPSANRFGHVSPTTADHVAADLGRCPIGIVDGEAGVSSASASSSDSADGATCAVGIESTVVKVDYDDADGSDAADDATAALRRVRLVVYRRGGVSVPQLERALVEIAAERGLLPSEAIPIDFVTLHKPTPAPTPVVGATASSEPSAAAEPAAGGDDEPGSEAPGMLLTHYAPDVDTYLVTRCGGGNDGSSSSATALPPALLPHAVVIDMGGALAALRRSALAYDDIALPAAAVSGPGAAPTGSLLAARTRLFAALRWSEGVPGARAVLLADPALLLERAAGNGGAAAAVEGAEHADALRDRMFRAASGRTVSVAPPPADTT